MGLLTKIAVKTAVKKSLLDITDRIELLHRQNPHLPVQERVKMFISIAGLSDELAFCKHWEGMFFYSVLMTTQSQLTTISNFRDYVPIIAELTSDWVNRVLGGKSENMYDDMK